MKEDVIFNEELFEENKTHGGETRQFREMEGVCEYRRKTQCVKRFHVKKLQR